MRTQLVLILTKGMRDHKVTMLHTKGPCTSLQASTGSFSGLQNSMQELCFTFYRTICKTSLHFTESLARVLPYTIQNHLKDFCLPFYRTICGTSALHFAKPFARLLLYILQNHLQTSELYFTELIARLLLNIVQNLLQDFCYVFMLNPNDKWPSQVSTENFHQIYVLLMTNSCCEKKILQQVYISRTGGKNLSVPYLLH